MHFSADDKGSHSASPPIENLCLAPHNNGQQQAPPDEAGRVQESPEERDSEGLSDQNKTDPWLEQLQV
jgi:hypothetical protein